MIPTIFFTTPKTFRRKNTYTETMTPQAYTSVPEYISQFPPVIRRRLESLRSLILSLAKGCTETISYGMPAYKLNGKPIAYFGSWKDHIGFYPTPSGTERFGNELSAYKTSKGAVQFPHALPLPLALIRKIVRFRIEAVR